MTNEEYKNTILRLFPDAGQILKSELATLFGTSCLYTIIQTYSAEDIKNRLDDYALHSKHLCVGDEVKCVSNQYEAFGVEFGVVVELGSTATAKIKVAVFNRFSKYLIHCDRFRYDLEDYVILNWRSKFVVKSGSGHKYKVVSVDDVNSKKPYIIEPLFDISNYENKLCENCSFSKNTIICPKLNIERS